MKKWLSSLVHYFFVATCDFCSRELRGNDFNRICLRCVARLENNGGVDVCEHCSQPLQLSRQTVSSQTYPARPDSTTLNSSTPSFPFEPTEETTAAFRKWCKTCIDEIPLQVPLQENRSLFFNRGLAQRLIYDFKFKPHSSYAPIVIYWSKKKLESYLSSFDVFIPIPLGKKGMYEREFCQVTKVTQGLAKQLKKPMMKVIVRNEKFYRQAQHQLSAQEREETVKSKYLYLPRYRGRFDGKKVLIVDDIYTTGSTLKNAAKLFTENNENVRVSSFTFLRTVFE